MGEERRRLVVFKCYGLVVGFHKNEGGDGERGREGRVDASAIVDCQRALLIVVC